VKKAPVLFIIIIITTTTTTTVGAAAAGSVVVVVVVDCTPLGAIFSTSEHYRLHIQEIRGE